jgi:hypothetical protein
VVGGAIHQADDPRAAAAAIAGAMRARK